MQQLKPFNADLGNIINYEKGKLPPQATDLEEAVLGALMIDRKGFEDIREILKPEHFYKDQHKYISEAIKQLGNEENNIDLLTVSQKLRQNAKLDLVGGDYYLIQLTQKVSSSAHIENHYKIIQQKYLQRELIKLSSETIEKAYDEQTDVFELIDEINLGLSNIDNETEVEQMPDINQQINEISFDKNAQTGLKSSIDKINTDFGEWQRGDLVIIAGRPGMGKSSVIIPEIVNALKNDETICLFSLEMTSKAFLFRITSFLTGIEYGKMIKKDVSKEEEKYIYIALAWIKIKKLFIFDKSYAKENIKNKCEKIKKKHSLDRVYIDHIGLIVKPKGNNNNEKMGQISNDLKRFAKTLNVCLFALSQLSRNVEQRGSSKRPLLSDLRDSGEIEQDADIVVFCYRPEYYKIEVWDDMEALPTNNTMELIFAKNRNGAVDNLRLNCYISTQRIGTKTFYDFEDLGQKTLNYKAEIKEAPIYEIKPATTEEAFGNQHFL